MRKREKGRERMKGEFDGRGWKGEHEFEEETFDDSVPTVPSRAPTLSTTPIPEIIPDFRSSSSVAVAPNLLIAQVKLF